MGRRAPVLPFLAAMTLVLAATTLVPGLSTFLPNLFYP